MVEELFNYRQWVLRYGVLTTGREFADISKASRTAVEFDSEI